MTCCLDFSSNLVRKPYNHDCSHNRDNYVMFQNRDSLKIS